MVSESSLYDGAERARGSLKSLNAVIERTHAMSSGEYASWQSIQRQYLLDSYTVKKFHRDLQMWEAAQNAAFGLEISGYNMKYTEFARLHGETAALDASLADVRSSLVLPQFTFSIQTLEQYEDGKFLENIAKDESGQYPRTVGTNDIFSLEDDKLPYPTYPDFHGLVSMEYRLRMQLQVKYEVLQRIKANLSAKNSQWADRDRKLEQFLKRDLVGVFLEVERIKKSEYEDLKYFEEEEGLDSDGFEENEENEEENGNENENEKKEEENGNTESTEIANGDEGENGSVVEENAETENGTVDDSMVEDNQHNGGGTEQTGDSGVKETNDIQDDEMADTEPKQKDPLDPAGDKGEEPTEGTPVPQSTEDMILD